MTTDPLSANDRIHFSRLSRALRFGIRLYGLFGCLAALGAGEVVHTYDYTGSDTNGNVVVKGNITLSVDETNRVNGFWNLKVIGVYTPKAMGRQDGTGKVVGRVNGDSIFLNLNPDMVDNNIYLDGRIAEANIAKINGTWGYYGFPGKVNEGDFEMVARMGPPTNSINPKAESPGPSPGGSPGPEPTKPPPAKPDR